MCIYTSLRLYKLWLCRRYNLFVSLSQSFCLLHFIMHQGRTPVHWEEVFVNFGTALDKRVVIHVWKDFNTLKSIISAGYRAIVSNSDVWYLDHLGTSWQQFYNNEPAAAVDKDHPEQMNLILGGEVCMWGETVDTSNVLSTIWPRAAAAAERLWSPQYVTDMADAELRLERFHCLLHERGVCIYITYYIKKNITKLCLLCRFLLPQSQEADAPPLLAPPHVLFTPMLL